MERRKILRAGSALAVLATTGAIALPFDQARAEPGALYDDDRILGEADAPVTIIEYSSLTCPHCAAFHENTMPGIKENWIAQGKARLVYRHFPLDGLALRAAAVANCFEGKRHFTFLEALFDAQRSWAGSEDPLADLAQLARLAGMDQSTFDSCVADESEFNRILERVKDAQSVYDVRSTPTIIVNGKKVTGTMSYEDFDKVLSEAAAQS